MREIGSLMNRLNQLLLILAIMISSSSFGQLDPNKLTHYNELDGTIVYDVLPDRMGNIWIATQGGLVLYNGYDYKRFHPDQNDSTTMGSLLTYKLHEDQNGHIWIGSLYSIFEYNPDTRSFKKHPFRILTDFPEYSQPIISSITPDGQGRIYFGISSNLGIEATHTLIYFDTKENELKRFEYPDSIHLNNITRLTSDPKGNIWMISHNGLFKIDTQHSLHHLSLPGDLKHNRDEYLNGIMADEDGTIWMTNTRAQLIAFDPQRGHTEKWSMDGLFEEEITSVYQIDMVMDGSQNIWLGSQQGLIFFDREKSSFEAFTAEVQNDYLRASLTGLQFDSFDNLWLGTRSNGLLKYNDRAIFKSFIYKSGSESSITAGWVDKIIELSNGNVLISTSGGTGEEGLNILDLEAGTYVAIPYSDILTNVNYGRIIGEVDADKILMYFNGSYKQYDAIQNSIEPINLGERLDSIHIYSIYLDSRGNLWFCTTDGVFSKEKKSGKLRHYDLISGEEDDNSYFEVAGAFESKINGLWLLSNNGLFLYDYDLDKVERHGLDPEKGGVLISQDINSFYEDENGIAWVGTWEGGLSRYNPKSGEIKTYTLNDGLPSMSIQGILGDEISHTLWLSTFNGISRLDIENDQFINFTLTDGIQGLLYADGSQFETSDGIFVFGGSNGVTYFQPDDVKQNSLPPKVFVTDFKIGNQSVYHQNALAFDQTDDIELQYGQNNISILYTGIQHDNPSKNKFAYMLENYDEAWREVGSIRSAYYYNLPPGDYTFRVKACNSNGVWTDKASALNIRVNSPWWKTIWAYIAYGFFLILMVIIIDRIQKNRLMAKERRQAKEKELEHAKEIEKAYHKLKDTQQQLIHAEKMASLGELTAGIAHEIQNPLNFVNNFSDVNLELIEELHDEIRNGDLEEASSLVEDIEGNEKKIIHHGKRADAIVKGMLLHSRGSSHTKELTDINSLADEYLRLSFHGLRAKDKTFNADFKADLDDSLPKIKVLPQDIGRVLLNLINNAFHAVSEKKGQNIQGYKPAVTVSTKNEADHIEIRVIDNGNGIPAEVMDKIFQPFFTTKSTGEGTGLGLSLSYDIITKGHEGELKVETREGEGAEFIIRLKK